MNDPELFSVYQFFKDGAYERVRHAVDVGEAADATLHYISCVAARTGLTRRVIVTNALDCTCFEWRYGEGVVFPGKEGNP